MLEEGIPKTWKFIEKVIKKEVKSKKQLKNKSCENKMEKKREKARCGTLPGGARGHTNHKDRIQTNRRKSPKRENAAYANTPWVPSGPERT